MMTIHPIISRSAGAAFWYQNRRKEEDETTAFWSCASAWICRSVSDMTLVLNGMDKMLEVTEIAN